MANVLFKRGDTATINGTAVTDGQLLYDTTTGQHYIDSDSTRKEVGKPVVNTTAEVSAITADYIPCGTKPVKELITSLNGEISKTTPILLWENPNPTVAFPSQTINFSSSEYEFYEVFCKENLTAQATFVVSAKSLRGFSSAALSPNTTHRRFTRVSDTSFSVETAYTGGEMTNNSVLIPIKIIGYK